MKLWVDGKEYTFSLKKISSRLYNASKIERLAFRISSSGYGIHWPLIDEDLSIDGLLGIKHYPPTIKYEYPQQHLLAVKEKSSIYKSKRNK
ncbi:MAG: DUF2442 domain-containing protein [Ignavibacteriales bacterium]|nr:DUF2442 domain-containing protein [Ignavibacteriales bacterium]